MASVSLRGVHKSYPGGHEALRGVDLDVADGELMVLVGPSGCGKSTALRILAGLDFPTRGQVLMGGEDITTVEARRRDVAMVFQSYALYPHKTVRGNLEFALRMRRVPRDKAAERIAEVAKALGIETLLDRRPAELSGGQRQRVALGRALVREPKLFLMDEPLSNLDAKLRVQTRAEVARIHRRFGVTTIYVTHDQEEAMTLGQRIAVLDEGVIRQVGPPMEIFDRPADTFVAGFIGSPSMNFIECRVKRSNGSVTIEGRGVRLTSDPAGAALPGEVILGIRPQDVELVPPSERVAATARVDVVETLGREMLLHLELEGDVAHRVVARTTGTGVSEVGDRLGLRFPANRLHLFDARTRRRLRFGPQNRE